MYTNNQSRLIGIALRAQAIADAVGEDFEFQSNPRRSDLQDLINSESPIHITDDTQMTMFGLEAMIHGGPTKVVEHYLMWRNTQVGSYHQNNTGLLVDDMNMWQLRAPGNTCLYSLQNIAYGIPVKNNSNGCGTVMKALPFLFEQNSRLLSSISFITHKGPQIIPTAIKQWTVATNLINKQLPNKYTGASLESVFGDGGWQAASCFDIALWAFENCAGDFNKLLELSILHGGDSDSVAATAGVLYGLYYETYPAELYNRITEKTTIDYLISTLP